MKDENKLKQQFEAEVIFMDDQGFSLPDKDYDVMWQIFEQYNNVPIGLLQFTLFMIRLLLENPRSNLTESYKKNNIQDIYTKLFSGGTEIKAITIETNNGPVTVKKGDFGFSLFSYPLYKAGQYLNDNIQTEAELRQMIIDQAIRVQIKYLCSKIKLGPQQLRVITGILYAHFNIFKSDPILTYKEHEKEYGPKGYNRYLNNRIRAIEKTVKNKIPSKYLNLLLSDLKIPDPRFKRGTK